jgi:type II secretory pathway pseudopilin PulG
VIRARHVVHAEGGFSLAETMVAMPLMLVVLAATLLTLNAFQRVGVRNQDQNDSQDRARNALEQHARELRNLASPAPNNPNAVDKAGPYDIVFQTVDPVGPNSGTNVVNLRRVRYCLDNGAADGTGAKIWTQAQTWTTDTPPAMPSTASCPDAAWPGTPRVVADKIVNRVGGRPVWTFFPNITTLLDAVPAGSLGTIRQIQARLYVDTTPGRPPAEAELRTGVTLRNQNQAPTCNFTATVTSSNHILLNGSTSNDPEAEALTYVWYDNGVKVATGVNADLGPFSVGSSHNLSLECLDPGLLEGVSAVINKVL